MRHTCAVLLLEKGVPVSVVSAMLGHASVKMTLDVYGRHVRPDSLDRAGDAMDAIFNARPAIAVQP